MDKERFCKIINELYEGDRLEKKIAAAVRQFNNIVGSDFPEPYGMVISHALLCQELLSEIMCDKHDDIGYFCNELDYGRSYEKGMIVDKQGNEIDLSTARNLYDFLMYQKNGENEIN